MKGWQQKKWAFAQTDKNEIFSFAKELNLSLTTASLLWQRGIFTIEEGRFFLDATEDDLQDPFLLKGMQEAVERIMTAIENKEKIVIYGDYDVDGITATSLLYRFFTKLRAQVDYYIPERQSEGYGLNKEAVAQLIESGVRVIVTVDCGISSYDIVDEVKELVDVIITDHHTAPEVVPPAYAVINPKQKGCPYPDKMLAGVGVAFKLCQAIWQKITGNLYLEDLDIVAIGTVADVVPLIGENRILTKLGLAKMQECPDKGLAALIQVAGLQDKVITAGHIGFTLAPRLNAAGRVTHATRGVELLISTDDSEAEQIAVELQETNIERQQIEREIYAQARLSVLEQGELAEKIMVVANEGWHPGVIGIVASRLVEEFYRPAIMISITDDIGKGSCRSIEGFDMYDALHSCKDLLLQFGGHKQAAGFSVAVENIDALRQRLIEYCHTHLTAEDYLPVIKIDTELTLDDIQLSLIEEIAGLEPYGMSNQTPVFAVMDATVQQIFILGYQKNHIKFVLEANGQTVEAIAWHGSHYQSSIFKGSKVRVAFTLQKNEWQGNISPQLILQDIQLLEKPQVCLSPECLRHWYVVIKRLLRNQTKFRYIVEAELLQQLSKEESYEAMLAVEVFKDLSIIEEESSERGAQYQWRDVDGKLDLFTSLTYLKYSS